MVQDVFHLTRVNNTGAAFGIMKGGVAVLAALTLFSAAVLAVYLRRHWSGLPAAGRLGWALVAGGALGNLHDRIFYGYVLDFLDFRVWPVFNVADAAVCIGVFFVAVGLIPRKGA